MRLGFRLVESLYPPNQPLNGGNPIENLTGNLKRKFQFMIVSFDTIIVNCLRVFSKSKIHAKARPATAVARESASLPRPESGPESGPQPQEKLRIQHPKSARKRVPQPRWHVLVGR